MDSSMLGQISGNPGVAGSEFLPEYKAIHNKLKKRFLRKPNVSEASDQVPLENIEYGKSSVQLYYI